MFEENNIDFQELFAVYLACRVWGRAWKGKHVRMVVDNEPVFFVLRSFSATSLPLSRLLRGIVLECVKWSFRIFPRHIDTKSNRLLTFFRVATSICS